MFLRFILVASIIVLSGCNVDTPKKDSDITTSNDNSTANIEITESNKSTLTSQQREVIRVHNNKRAIYFTDSPLKYSLKLEHEAQIYADILAQNGKFEHDINNHKNNYGENLYASTKKKALTINDAMPHWFEEEEPHYNYDDGSCDIGFQCGHYTQVIWQNTKEVGCATAKYKRGEYKDGFVYVCKYYRAGNIFTNGEAEKPYCSYDMSDFYLKASPPSTISLAGKKFSIELIDEDRVNCTRTNIDNSVIEFNSDVTQATIPDFQIFNNGEYPNSLEFDNISIEDNLITLVGINKNISDTKYKNKVIYMKIRILADAEDYYTAELEWNGLDKNLPQYSRRMRAKLYHD